MSVTDSSSSRQRRQWRIRRSLLKTRVVTAAVGALGFVAPIAQLLLEGRPIDNTVPHGDACLTTQDQRLRCWDEFVPEAALARPAPLVVDLHGFLNTVDRQRRYTNYEPLAEADGVVLARPYGIDWSWNGGGEVWPTDTKLDKRPGIGCCGHALNNDIDDVAFVVAMIEKIRSTHRIDPDRVYLSGFSNGCILAQRIAAEASDVIAGVACMAGHLLVDPAPDYDPVPILEIHGTADPVSEYEPSYWPGSVANFDEWSARNGCRDEPIVVWEHGPHTMLEARGCTNEARVALMTLVGFGHAVFAGEGWLHIDTSRVAWDFMIGPRS